MDDSRLSERERFLQCYKRLIGFVFREDNSSRTNIGLLLDELNSIDYSEKFVREEEANELLYHLCRILPLYEKRLLVKVCQSIYNLTAKQQINTRDEVLLYVTKYLIEAIQRSQQWELVEILHAFGAVLYENVGRVSQFHDVLISKDGILMSLILEDAGSEDILRGAVQCVENLTIRVSTQSYMEDVHAMECFKALLKLLHKVPASRIESVTQCKILICCLRGLQNILSTSKIISTNNLGPLLAALRVLMFHGLTTTPMTIPESLNPTPLSQYNIPSTQSPQPTPPAEEQPQEAKQKSGKKTRKKKGKKTTENTDKSTDETECGRDSYNTTSLSSSRPSSTATGNNPALRPAWYKVSSSESEYSDSEGGQASRFKSLCGKVRQNVLSCLLAVIKNSEKRVLFGYWSALIPDSGSSGNTHQAQSLIAAILKDPSPKCRMAGLAALTALIDGTKTFLAAASDSEQMNTAFTPFSTVLGSTIRELHRCLLLVLVSENFPLTLTQSIKCLSVLISNVPYHRMKPGLLSRIVKQVRNFLNHRDPNVRVACLTCFGAVAAIQPPMFEICHIIQSPKPGANTDVNQPTTDVNPDISKNKIDSGISSSHSNSPSNSNGLQGATANITLDSGSDSPNVGSSGIETPLFTDRTLQAQAHDVSWLIKLCVKNTLPQSANETGYGGRTDEGQGYVEPLPVRLESLQVLGHLAKGYFPIIRNSLPVLQNLIQVCYCDTDQVVRLHTSKLLDSVTQALLKEVSDTNDSSGTRLTIPQVTDVWLSLLNGPVANELQLESHNAVKATTCDCISNIGPDVFSALPIDKRILCITLILGLTSDEDRIVRSAAVRCLGVFILYPCLREDVSFVADVANAILMLMDDSSLNVRFKTTWSLANLCDALVVNKNENDNDFMEDFSDMLLQKLFTTSIKACQDSDKVKSNAVRALGNIMRYLPSRSLGKSSFRRAVEEGIAALIKNIKSGTMKVRWNACYAVSNMFKNSLLSHDGAEWTKDLLLVLCSVVKDCKNFKVRTNAAIALGTPTQRAHYGEIRLFSSVCESLVVGLQTSEEVTDFAEYRYRSNLNDQLCVSFLHLMTLVDVNDLESMQSMLLEKSAVIAEHFDKFRTSLGEDKTQTESDFQKFKTRLSTLSSENLSTSQQSTVDLLRELLVFDELRNSPERKAEKSAFVQIYD